ncbi:hypothetical protein O6H91_18G083700 [Diphasiastrum complanatum]|uniref:Uncharacterized protein n=1 Tax=Diphasiastrum complanatum TaxID=34168 RepID=A0ACC2B3D3_DIPCM|nr:hypothetical protein O6H91_Y358600 [Diphasiastrum complanatum]KAJ7524260.1 hypothetical protein O6H91_18G083700 [Diphasiastrum complanatum]
MAKSLPDLSPFHRLALHPDDPLPLSTTIAHVKPTAAAHFCCHHHPRLTILGHSQALKPLKAENLRGQTNQQQRQVVVLEAVSNPSHALSSDRTAVADVDPGRLMMLPSLPWLVSDVQLRSVSDDHLNANPSSLIVFHRKPHSEWGVSVDQRIAQKQQNGLPVASKSSAGVQSTTPPASRQKQESPGGDNYHVNTGYAIRTLREELPSMFHKDLNYEIYREDITFKDPLNTFSGIHNYKLIFWALRFHGQIFFRVIWVDILRVWQPSEKVITVRWTVRGIPRVPWEAQGRFDGTSEYKLDKEGKIYEHKVDNIVINSPPKFKSVTVLDLVRVAGVHTTPTPTFFYRVWLHLGSSAPFLEQFTWVRFYLAMESTVALLG